MYGCGESDVLVGRMLWDKADTCKVLVSAICRLCLVSVNAKSLLLKTQAQPFDSYCRDKTPASRKITGLGEKAVQKEQGEDE